MISQPRKPACFACSSQLVVANSGAKLEAKRCSFVPGLLHIVDEILVNAADNTQRNQGARTRIAIAFLADSFSS